MPFYSTIVRMIVPSVVLALVPKCPACFAMYFALATGIGLSLTAAAYLQGVVIGCSVALLLFATMQPMRRLRQRVHIWYRVRSNTQLIIR